MAARLKTAGRRSLVTALQQIDEPRGGQGKRHPLACCLSMVVCAVEDVRRTLERVRRQYSGHLQRARTVDKGDGRIETRNVIQCRLRSKSHQVLGRLSCHSVEAWERLYRPCRRA